MEQQEYLIVTNKHLRESLPLLEKYYGINIGHFEREIMAAWSNLPECERDELVNELKEGDSLTVKYLDTDNAISILIEKEVVRKIFQLLNDFEGDADPDDGTRIFNTLYLLAYILLTESVKEELDHEEFYMDLVNAEIRQSATRDLLRLFIYMKEREGSSVKNTRLVIKPSDGANIELENINHWFPQKLIAGLLDNTDLISGVETVEQAKELLKNMERSGKNGGAGRPTDNPRVRIVSFGIYRLFNDYVKMSSPIPDSLCDFINEYLRLVKILKSGERLENSRIRTDVRTEAEKLKMGKQTYKFEEKDVIMMVNSSDWGHYDKDWFPKMAKS